jgi:PAS domain-containing protein
MAAHSGLPASVFTINSKNRADFAEEDLDLLAGFAPHLGRVLGLRIERSRALAELNANRQILDDTEDPVLLLDSGLRVIHANAAAASLLDRGDGLRLRHWRLVARHPDDDARLQAVLYPGPRLGQPVTEDYAVVRRRERRPLLVKVIPLGPSSANGSLP